MLGNKYISESTIALLVAAILVVAGGFAMVAVADEATDYEDLDEPLVFQDEVVLIEGDGIEEDEQFVTIDSDGAVQDVGTVLVDGDERVLVANENDQLEVNTWELFDGQDPRNNGDDGEYETRSLYDGDLRVIEQNADAGADDETFVVELAGANVDFAVTIQDENGDLIGGDTFEAGSEIGEYEFELEEDITDGSANDRVSVEDGDELTVSVHHIDDHMSFDFESANLEEDAPLFEDESANGDYEIEVLQETVEINDVAGEEYDSPDNSNEASVFGEVTSFDWEITVEPMVDEVNADDQRVWEDATDTIPSNGVIGTSVFIGQELVFADDASEFPADEVYRIEKEDDDGNFDDLVQELTPSESDTVNAHELVVETNALDEDEPSGTYRIVDESGDKLVEWTQGEQDLEAVINPEDGQAVNINTEDDTADLNVTGNRIGYDVIIQSEQLDEEELVEIIQGDVEIEDEDEETVRVSNVADNDAEDTIDLDFDGYDTGAYGFQLSPADADAEAVADVTVADGDVGTAEFGDTIDFESGMYQVDRGNIVELQIDMTETDVATFIIDEENYEVEFDVEDTDSSDDVVLEMDTYRANENTEHTVDHVFTAQEGGEILNPEESVPPVYDEFATGYYNLVLEVDGEETDISTLQVNQRDSHSITTWALPNSEDASIESIEEGFATEKDIVADEDHFVIDVEATGLFSEDLITEDTHPSAFIDYDQRSELTDGDVTGPEDLDIADAESLPEITIEAVGEGQNNSPDPVLRLENADSIEYNDDRDRFFVFFERNSDGDYGLFDDRFEMSDDDWMTEYDLHLNVTDDYKYHGDGDNDMVETTYEKTERVVSPTLSTVVVDEESADTRYMLPQEENVTVSGTTHVAPGTEGEVIVRADGEDPFRQTVDYTVTDNGTVEGDFDLSSLETDRDMSIQFFPPNTERNDAIITEPQLPPEIADLTSTTPVNVGDEVEFDIELDNAEVDEVTYDWQFDDGSSSGAASPVHIYDEAGTYTVEVVVENAAGETDSETTDVVVEEVPATPPQIEEIIAPDGLETGEEATFAVIATDDQQSGTDLQYQWDFDDGTSGSGTSTTHTFNQEGVYSVTVTATNDAGLEDVQDVTVQVEESDENGEEEVDENDLTVTVLDDEEDAVLPGATVQIDDEEGNLVEGVETGDDGSATVELEDGSYEISIGAEGYESFDAQVSMDGEDEEIEVGLEPEDENGEEEEDPDQPGFTLLLAALVLAAAGGYVYYRRELQGV